MCRAPNIFFFIDIAFSHTCMFFFFNDTATTEIYTLSLHDALPISVASCAPLAAKYDAPNPSCPCGAGAIECSGDRKSTRLNSSHVEISYAVFCLKKKNKSEFIGCHLLASGRYRCTCMRLSL